MKSRVTITLDPEVHQLARKAAKRKKTTVSGLIESLLKDQATPESEDWVSSIIGIAEPRNPEPGTDPLYDALAAKFLRK